METKHFGYFSYDACLKVIGTKREMEVHKSTYHPTRNRSNLIFKDFSFLFLLITNLTNHLESKHFAGYFSYSYDL